MLPTAPTDTAASPFCAKSAGANHRQGTEKEKQRSAGAGKSEQDKQEKDEERDVEAGRLTGAELQMLLHRVERDKVVVSNKIHDLQQDLSEHKVVLEAFQTVESSRTCFRLVGGVLVQRTVGEVQPVLQAHKQKVEAALKELDKELDALMKKQTDYSQLYMQVTGRDLQSTCSSSTSRSSSSSRGDGGKDAGEEAQPQQRPLAGGVGILV